MGVVALAATAGAQESPSPDAESGDTSGAEAEARLFTNVRPLTSDGRRSGEGYYGADGTKMVFQSERETGNPFYQIYLLDFEQQDISRISPGIGKTTCAWLHPSGQRALFASTHEDPDAKRKQRDKILEREAGTESRYSWDYDPWYEIYAYEFTSGEYTRLTHATGYDAEGSYSPDGTKIAWASNRRAYLEGELSDDEREHFRFHEESAMDIYIMDADGSNVHRLTDEPGYDGGPFFSPDGKRICWRRFKPDMTSAEVWTMKVDGSDKQQLTQLDATSFGPFYHPSGEYLLFISNPEGYANFEIYMIPAAKRADFTEPVRVTWTDGFDGFPTFSLDGKTFSWTSNRVGNVSQLFAADWDHEAARKLLELDRATASTPGGEETVDTKPDERTGRAARELTSAAFTKEDVLRHVDYLCRPELAGRMTGTAGERRATAYVAAYLDSLGFVPAGEVDAETGETTWFQSFDFPAGARLGEENWLVIGETESEPGDEWMPLNFSGTGSFDGEVAFAGYGIVAPKTDNGPEYDSFVHLDVTDKWVLVFRYLPEDVTPEWRQDLNFHSQLRVKAANVRDRGGLGMLVVSGPNSSVKQQVIALSTESALGKISIPVVSISDELAQQMMKSAGQDLPWWQTQLDRGEPQLGFDFPDLNVSANIDVIQQRGRGRNVIGRLQFGDQPSREAVVVGAHIDHLGRGGAGSMARDEEEKGQIHFGADDNASGVAGMLEVAEFLAFEKRDGKIHEGRDLIAAAWSGEELGLFGSSHFVKQAQRAMLQRPDASDRDLSEVSLNPRYVAYLNMDMIGRFDGKLVLQGLGSSDWWSGEIEKRNLATGIVLHQSLDTNLPTDATEFYRAGVPILAAFTGTHDDYHTPRDTPEKLNYPMASRIARLMGLVTRSLVTGREVPAYKEYKSADPVMRVAMRASLGTSPDYTAEVVGTMLKSVRSGSPADKAGIQGGDAVVELAGRSVENVYDYTNAIAALKVGEEVTIVVVRDGQRLELKITPESRD